MGWKLATFNVNGIRARLPAVLEWLKTTGPDVLCLQEIKCLDGNFPLEPFLDLGYRCTVRGQKSFNGVAVLSKSEPAQVLRGFDDGGPDDEARFLAVLVDDVWVVNTYVPQGRHPDDPAFERKLAFFPRLGRWFSGRFDPASPIIWTGDINVAPAPLDVYDPKRMDGKVGFHPAEREALSGVLAWGFTDLFRLLHPDLKQFSFWDYRIPGCYSKNLGWRIDHILATAPLASRCIECAVDEGPRAGERPSDHTPVWAEFERLG